MRVTPYPHAVCLALEQDFVETQSAPSMDAEHGHYGTYEVQAPLGLEMAEYIRSLGYHAQVHGPSNHRVVYLIAADNSIGPKIR